MRPGTTLIWIGLAIAAVGLVVRFAPWLVSWFGTLPGDIRIERPTTTVYIPITSMIVVSILASVVLTILLRWR